MKRFLPNALILLLIACVGLYFGANFLLKKATYRAIQTFSEKIPKHGMSVSDVRFKRVRITSWNSILWRKISGAFRAEKIDSLPAKTFNFTIKDVTLKFADFPPKKFIAEGGGVGIEFVGDDGKIQQTIHADYFKVTIEGEFQKLDKSIERFREVGRELMALVHIGKTVVPVELEGVSSFKVMDRQFSIRVRVIPKDGKSRLKMDRKDLLKISEYLKSKDEVITEAEVDILSDYPQLAPKLLKIVNYSHKVSEEAHKKNSRVPQDAFRHILWSYLLTKEFGEYFAKKVTDAHEETEQESWADKRMDYNNNELGRKYAQKGYPEDRILERVMRDPDVIRSSKSQKLKKTVV